MPTIGKVPFLGFKAGAVKFLTLFGFSIGQEVVPDENICLVGEHREQLNDVAEYRPQFDSTGEWRTCD